MAGVIPDVKKLWDPSHPDGTSNVNEDEALTSTLINGTSLMCNILQLSDRFEACLNGKRVLDVKTTNAIRATGPRNIQVFHIIGYLMSCKVYHLHGFMWSLVHSGQGDIVERLGFHVADYMDMEINASLTENQLTDNLNKDNQQRISRRQFLTREFFSHSVM